MRTVVDRYVDVTDPDVSALVIGDSLRSTLRALARRPFRTRPTLPPRRLGRPVAAQRRLGIETDAPNLAWSYELITPESGILLGDGDDDRGRVRAAPGARARRATCSGTAVAERFGASFPIRFDYLDTMEGGHLSLQCHPTQRYARETFGLDYTQDETYYVMETTPGGSVFLGLRDDADLDAFRERRRARGVRRRRVRCGPLRGTPTRPSAIASI